MSTVVRRGRFGRRPSVRATWAVVIVCVVLAVPALRSLHGFGIVAALVLAGLDIVMVRATDAIAFRWRGGLDERQTAIRNRAYRRGFRLLGVAIVAIVVLALLSASLFTPEVDNGITGRSLIAMVELVIMMPTLVLASMDTGPFDVDTAAPHRSSVWRWASWLVLPVIFATWVLVVELVPTQGALASPYSNSSDNFPGATCQEFAAGRIVGAEFGASVDLLAQVCWNGTDAFVFGDPNIPLPASAIHALEQTAPPGVSYSQDEDPYDASLWACGQNNIDDFATVVDVRCSGSIDADGTLHYTVTAQVDPLPFGIGPRDVTLELSVNREGKVIIHP